MAFPYAPYERAIRLLLIAVGGVLAVTMLVVSVSYLAAGREITGRLQAIGQAMSRVRQGDRSARVAGGHRRDELEKLARHFNGLLDTIAQQDASQKVAQKPSPMKPHVVGRSSSTSAMAWSFSMKTALYLRPTLVQPGCWATQLMSCEACTRQPGMSNSVLPRLLTTSVRRAMRGELLETVHRRKDGTTYAAEITTSKVRWGDRTFILTSQRDISERKAVEAELGRYRINLEQLVEQRTAS